MYKSGWWSLTYGKVANSNDYVFGETVDENLVSAVFTYWCIDGELVRIVERFMAMWGRMSSQVRG